MFSFVKSFFGRLFTSYDKRNAIKAEQAAQHRELSTSNAKVSGWRNGIGWICVFGMAYQMILRDLLIWGAKSGYYAMEYEPPSLDGRLWSLVFGMLGIAEF